MSEIFEISTTLARRGYSMPNLWRGIACDLLGFK
jgi:hypothetical protein